MRGDESPHWIGDEAGYRAIHARLTAARGKASLFDCVSCFRSASDWSFVGSAKTAKWHRSGRYLLPFSHDPDDYKPMCRKCNIKFGTRSKKVPWEQRFNLGFTVTDLAS